MYAETQRSLLVQNRSLSWSLSIEVPPLQKKNNDCFQEGAAMKTLWVWAWVSAWGIVPEPVWNRRIFKGPFVKNVVGKMRLFVPSFWFPRRQTSLQSHPSLVVAAEKVRGECSFLGIARSACPFLWLLWGKRRREKGNYWEGLLLDPTWCGYVNLVYKICHFVFRILLAGTFFFSFAISKWLVYRRVTRCKHKWLARGREKNRNVQRFTKAWRVYLYYVAFLCSLR